MKAVVLVNLGLCLAAGGRRRKGFGDSFTFHSAREPDLGIMTGIIGFGAVATGLTATASNGANRT